MNINFNEGFSPAQAERGKFAVLDMSTLSPAYPSAGAGRYAVLTYQVGTAAANASGTPVPTNNTVINRSLTIDAGDVEPIDFGTTVNYLEIYNNDQRAGLPLTYVALANPTNFATLSSTGMILNKTAFYSVNHEGSTIWVGASGVGTVDLRIIGHRSV